MSLLPRKTRNNRSEGRVHLQGMSMTEMNAKLIKYGVIALIAPIVLIAGFLILRRHPLILLVAVVLGIIALLNFLEKR